jgi:hypothetical protein
MAALNFVWVSTAAPFRSLPQLVLPIQVVILVAVFTNTLATAKLRREKKSFQLLPGYLQAGAWVQRAGYLWLRGCFCGRHHGCKVQPASRWLVGRWQVKLQELIAFNAGHAGGGSTCGRH